MPRIQMQTTHNLGRDEAARRLKEKFSTVRDRYGAQVNDLMEKWTDHTFSFQFKAMGLGINGVVQVDDTCVKLDANLPLPALLLKGTIERRIGEELAGLLS